ncbi:MAG: SDR family NAD(P)-dependent oxidoreductase [Myxococcota bacterium]
MFQQRYGPWAVIVGGSEGVGASFARKLARAGLDLVLLARKPGPLAELEKALRSEFPVEVRTASLDVTAPDLLAQVKRLTDDLDVGLLIYNAGSVLPQPFLDAPLEDALHAMRLNPIGQLTLCHHFGRRLRARERGGIILVGSISGCAGAAGTAVYSGAKAFTQRFGEGLWAALKPCGVDVLTLVIGATRTPFMERAGLPLDHPDMPASDPDDIAQLGLDELANGPVQVPAHLQETFAALSSMPRRAATEVMTRAAESFNA